MTGAIHFDLYTAVRCLRKKNLTYVLILLATVGDELHFWLIRFRSLILAHSCEQQQQQQQFTNLRNISP